MADATSAASPLRRRMVDDMTLATCRRPHNDTGGAAIDAHRLLRRPGGIPRPRTPRLGDDAWKYRERPHRALRQDQRRYKVRPRAGGPQRRAGCFRKGGGKPIPRHHRQTSSQHRRAAGRVIDHFVV